MFTVLFFFVEFNCHRMHTPHIRWTWWKPWLDGPLGRALGMNKAGQGPPRTPLPDRRLRLRQDPSAQRWHEGTRVPAHCTGERGNPCSHAPLTTDPDYKDQKVQWIERGGHRPTTLGLNPDAGLLAMLPAASQLSLT